MTRAVPHSSHWGAFTATLEPDGADGGRLDVRPHPADPEPSPLLGNLAVLGSSRARVDRPYARRGWLEDGPGPDVRRGDDTFVPLAWDEAVERLGAELRRVYDERGPQAVFGGSYGWSSAGRFHHAQSQVHRFLNALGGYVRSQNNYSYGASAVILPHVLGNGAPLSDPTTWPMVAGHTDLFVCFGGLPAKNVYVNAGGASRHRTPGWLRTARERGAEFVTVGPLRDDLAAELGGQWLPVRPGSDVAAMLALAYVLVDEDRHDRAFLDRYTSGFEAFRRYLTGESDGVPKTPGWAEPITGVPADELTRLARRMSAGRTMVSVAWSLQRARHGEQPVWMGIVLAAMLGTVGLPGGGFGHGYGSFAAGGDGNVRTSVPTLPQGHNAVRDFIPVARIADMLLHPGEPYDYDGERRTYPSIDLVHWAGGNPFHHHQDLGRLRRAWRRPSTVVVHEPFWTATARHADLVLPATTTVEREDIGAARDDDLLIAMHRVREPYAEARDDYDVFSDLTAAFGEGAHKTFTEGRTTRDWLRHLYTRWQVRNTEFTDLDFDAFWAAGHVELRRELPERVLLADFRRDPDRLPLRTPSGRIEIHSPTIASFGYDDCPGHPTWMEPEEWTLADRFPLRLVANNPATRLHSQLDHGDVSAASKVHDREPVRLHPDTAAARGLSDGAVVRIFNDRGACLAGLVTSDAVAPGVVQLSTGAWYDPRPEDGLCVHGNPNVLTADVGTSRLAQGCSGQHAQVEVEAWTGELPPIRAYDPPVA